MTTKVEAILPVKWRTTSYRGPNYGGPNYGGWAERRTEKYELTGRYLFRSEVMYIEITYKRRRPADPSLLDWIMRRNLDPVEEMIVEYLHEGEFIFTDYYECSSKEKKS